jgi:hypothetical protein
MNTEDFFYWVVLVFFRLLLWGNEKVSRSIPLIIHLKNSKGIYPTDEHGGFFLLGCTGVLSFTSVGNEKVSRSIPLIIHLKNSKGIYPTEEHGGIVLMGCFGVL